MKTYRELLEDVAALESRSERATPPLPKLTEGPFVSSVSTPPARSEHETTTEEGQRRAWGESRSERATPPLPKLTKDPFVGFDSAPPARSEHETTTADKRREWGDQLSRDLHGWLSVHPRHVWRSARIWEVIAAPLERLEGLVRDYETTGEPGDRRAAVFAANGVAAVAARAAREWEERFNTAGH